MGPEVTREGGGEKGVGVGGAWVLPLQVDNMYIGGWAGELRGGRGGGGGGRETEPNRGRGRREGEREEVGQREFYRYSGEGEAWLKESTPMETNKILF